MRTFIILFCALILQACGASTNKEGDGMTDSKMSVEIGGENYEVDVRYYLSEADGLTMYSDKNDVSDSNGDGLIFAIFEYNGKLQFDFVKDGDRMGAQISEWQKTNDKITGSGELKPESGLGQGVPVSFSLNL